MRITPEQTRKNKTKEFCKLIGVEYEKPFRIKILPQNPHERQIGKNKLKELEKKYYVIGENGIYEGDEYYQCYVDKGTISVLENLIIGYAVVIKEPFKPGLNELYYVVDKMLDKGYFHTKNIGLSLDKRIIKYSTIAKTEEEIIELRNQQEWWEE